MSGKGTVFYSHSLEETAVYAHDLAAKLPRGSVILLSGDLGAGKTTFTRGFVGNFGMGHLVSSPTFSIMNEYWNQDITIYHFDLYRLHSPEEVDELGLEDFIRSADYALVEWPDIAEHNLDFPVIRIDIRFGEKENDRTFVIEGLDTEKEE